MLLQPDCILCNYKASLAAIREITSDEQVVKDLMSSVSQVAALRGPDWSITSPEVLEMVFTKVTAELKNGDPFTMIKQRQNQKGLELYPLLRNMVVESEDPIHTAVNLAIIGNSLDVMWSEGSVNVEPILYEQLKNPVPAEHYLEFTNALEKAGLLLYFADNCGEAVFDRLLIETLVESHDLKVYYVTRSVPALNDVTPGDAKDVGVEQIATVIENGIDGPLPGTILSRCSEQVRSLVQEADLIISKGGGNFDTLDEEANLPDTTFFMLMCKCLPYTNLFGVDLYNPILRSRRFQRKK